MKKSLLKFLLPMTIVLTLLSCTINEDDEDVGTEVDLPNELHMFEQEMNPEYDSRTKALDVIFNPDELGKIILVFDRSEWNKHLDYCDLELHHEENVVAKGFYFAKDNKEWFFKDIGFRIRGNTSRIRPQDFIGKYVPAHFALDFEEWLTKEDDADKKEKKLAGAAKGLILKRFKDDPTYSREIYGYNMFRQNGIWIAPRAAYTRLIIQIQEADGSYETINYGVYAMIEEVKKQFLKERTTPESGGNLTSNKGNLWKLSWPSDFKNIDANSIGEESSKKITDTNGNVTGIKVQSFPYDFKSGGLFEEAKTQLIDFINELNALPNCKDGNNDEADIATIKDFYTNKMDGDLFLRTYAVNVILGMWDDYWMNSNNFYFYFDESGKAYFIPFDYDNILGVNGLNTDIAKHSPIAWGNLDDGNRPLIQKILQVPEYMQDYKVYLDEFSNEESYFDDDKSIERIKKWQEMIKPYIYGRKLNYTFEQKNKYFCKVYKEIADFPADWGSPYKKYTLYTPGDMNYFTVRQNTIKQHLGKSDTLILTLDAGKGYFYQSQSNYQIKSYTYTFKKGDSLQKILDANGFNGWTYWYNNDDKSFLFGYEENGIFYYPDWFCDEEGNWVDEYQTFTTSTVLGSIYRRFYNVTFDLNGGTYQGSTNSVKKLVPEVYYLKNFAFTPTIEGKAFWGWTLTPDGDDYVSRMPSEDITVYAKWEEADEF
ncbi:MAG: CotH kinase family protein [Treponema sp.]|nr:CotH kinase family protein [Treponema sp.]